MEPITVLSIIALFTVLLKFFYFDDQKLPQPQWGGDPRWHGFYRVIDGSGFKTEWVCERFARKAALKVGDDVWVEKFDPRKHIGINGR